MKKDNLKKMIYQADEKLHQMCIFSESKRKAKTLNRNDPEVRKGNKSLLHDKIFSYRTYRKYRDICCTFLRWCHDMYPEEKHYSVCRKYVGPYLKDCRNRGVSIKTVSNYRVALVKLYGFSPKDFNIQKLYGRKVDVDEFRKYRYYSEDNDNWFRDKELTVFICCTGLRKNEVRNLTGDMLAVRNNDYYIHVTKGSKGGRERYAKIIGDKKEIEFVADLMKTAKHKRVFPCIPDDFSYHILRSIYACRFIDMVAVCSDNTSKEEKYFFKGEARGFCVKRSGMKKVSNSLGHNRIEVIRNYFRKSLYNKTFGKRGIEIVEEVYDLLKCGNKFI